MVGSSKPSPNSFSIETQEKKRHLKVGDKVYVKGAGDCIISKLTTGWVRVKPLAGNKKEEWYTYPSSYDNGTITLIE